LREGNWVLLDYNDVIVHIFYAGTRKFYDLEGLWHEAKHIRIDE
jgi:ribosome-associated protein